LSNFFIVLVSSATIKSTSFNVLISLKLASSRLPIGVAQIKRVPLIFPLR
jgi:hypothetical protein